MAIAYIPSHQFCLPEIPALDALIVRVALNRALQGSNRAVECPERGPVGSQQGPSLRVIDGGTLGPEMSSPPSLPGRFRRPGLGWRLPSLSFWAPRRVSRLLIATASVPAVLALAIPALVYATRGETFRALDLQLARTEAVAFWDSAGHLAGIHAQPGLENEYRTGQIGLRMATRGQIPDEFFELLRWREDRHSAYHYFGLNLPALGWATACEIAGSPDWLSKIHQCTGGSGLLANLASFSRGRNGDTGGSYSRKLREVWDTMALSTRYSLDDAHSRQSIAGAAVYVKGTGGDLRGPEIAARLLWGRSLANTSLAQRALLAVFYKRPWALSCAPRDSGAAEWKRVKELARKAISEIYGARSTMGAQALAELAVTPIPLRPFQSDPALEALAEADRCMAALNPVHRLDKLISGPSIFARRELARAKAGGRLPEPVSDVVLSVDIANYRREVRRYFAALASVERSNSGRLIMPLIGPPGTGADVLLVRADHTGLIRSYLATTALPAFTSPRRPASLGKLLVVLAAAAEGRDPQTPLCVLRDRLTGVRNADKFAGYDNCNDGRISLAAAMATSNNLAILQLAREVDPAMLADVIEAFGAGVPAWSTAANATTLGTLEVITPQRLMAGIAAMQNCIEGRPALAPMPTLIEQVTVGGKEQSLSSGEPIDLRRFCQNERARGYLKVAGHAALSGTLAGIDRQAQPVAPDEIAKSGTDSTEGKTTAKYVLGANGLSAYYGGVWPTSGAMGANLNFVPLWARLRSTSPPALRKPD